MSIPHLITARTVAVLGHDFVMIDAQHAYAILLSADSTLRPGERLTDDKYRPIDAVDLVSIIQTFDFSSGGNTVSVVRVPSAHSHLLTYALDAGTLPSDFYNVLSEYPL
jgi:2-keto-3-deoxy-L-rhamnonate aldolase RhmA